MDPSLAIAKKIREYEEQHPFQAIAGGFVPGIGQAQSAAAIRDPEAPLWEKALNVPGLVPGAAGVSKALIIGARMAKGNEALESSLKVAKKLLKDYKVDSPDVTKGPKGVKDLVRGDPRINDRIAKETGWFVDPDTGKWMTEIDDSRSIIDLPMMQESEFNKVFGQEGQVLSLADTLHHPELAKLPEGRKMLAEMNVQMDPSFKRGSARYQSGPDTDMITFNEDLGDPSRVSSIRDILLHEPMHGIASREGFMPGTNVQAAGGMKEYMEDPGEILARLAALRRNMTPDARRKFPFHRNIDEERARLAVEPTRYANEEDLKRWLKLRNLDPEEMLVPGP